MIGRSGERWSGISVLAARHDDDDDFTKRTSMAGLFYAKCYFSTLMLSCNLYQTKEIC